jgi:transposase
LVAENLQLRRIVDVQAERIGQLEKLIEEVRRGGKRQAAPFSKGDPKQTPKKSGRKAGEDHGTHSRRRLPSRDADRVVPVALPDVCPHCGDGELVKVKTMAQWVEDLPDIATILSRFDIAVGCCAGCGRRVQGRDAEQSSDALGAAASQVGPRALALAGWLHKSCGMPLAKVCALFAQFHLAVTPGGLSQAMDRMADKSFATYEALKTELAAQAVVSPDETGWRVGGRSAWLWAFAATTLTVYAICEGRGFDEATTVLPADFAGTLCRDGWAPYRKFTAAAHQTCLAHLLRRAREMSESSLPEHRDIPNTLSAILHDALAVRALRDAGTFHGDGLDKAIAALESRVEALLETEPGCDDNRRLLKHVRKERSALFTFLRKPGVEATNWRAENAIRPAVVNRKVCGGNRSWYSAETQQILMTLFRTAYQQGADTVKIMIDLLRSPQPTIAPLALPLTGKPDP